MTLPIPPSLPKPRRRDHWQHVQPWRNNHAVGTLTGTRFEDGSSYCLTCHADVELTPEWDRYWQREADRREPLRQALIAELQAGS